jgi:hypothetical protein
MENRQQDPACHGQGAADLKQLIGMHEIYFSNILLVTSESDPHNIDECQQRFSLQQMLQ